MYSYVHILLLNELITHTFRIFLSNAFDVLKTNAETRLFGLRSSVGTFYFIGYYSEFCICC